MTLAHPLTGILLDADNLERLTEVEAQVEDELGRIYRARRPLRARIAELQGPAVLPSKPRWRTDTQSLVAYCPRCGGGVQTASGGTGVTA